MLVSLSWDGCCLPSFVATRGASGSSDGLCLLPLICSCRSPPPVINAVSLDWGYHWIGGGWEQGLGTCNKIEIREQYRWEAWTCLPSSHDFYSAAAQALQRVHGIEPDLIPDGGHPKP